MSVGHGVVVTVLLVALLEHVVVVVRSLAHSVLDTPRAEPSSMTLGAVDLGTAEKIDDVFFGEWLEAPAAFGAFDSDRLVGFAEGSIESWNNRFRISNICIFDSAARGKGTGRRLMEAIEREAAASGARMIVLETQSCNEAAIAFYRKNGFSVIGFDLYAFSNTDPERHEVRIEMGKKLHGPSVR